MNKQWDGLGSRPEDAYRWHLAWAREAFRVLKPGGWILAFGGTRTVHRLACAIEDAGFECRDLLMWITAAGFPKGKANLKPAHEPIVLARKPGPLRPLGIDACRIPGEPWTAHDATGLAKVKFFTDGEAPVIHKEPHNAGRWPSNVLLDPDSAALFDEPNPEVVGSGATVDGATSFSRAGTGIFDFGDQPLQPGYGDTGGYSRFFLIPKAGRSDREPVLRGQLEPVWAGVGALRDGTRGQPPDNVYCTCETDKPEWVSEGQGLPVLMGSTSLRRDTSEATSEGGFDWPTLPSGSDTSVPSPLDDSSTTSTATSRTTESPTSSLSIPSPISDSTPAASSSTESGGSLAGSAASFERSPSTGGTSHPKDGRSMGAAEPAISRASSETSNCEDCGGLKPLSGGPVEAADGVAGARRNSHPT